MTITIEPVNNGIYNDDIPVTIDGSIGSDIEATAVEEVMVTIRNDDFDGTITASPLMLAEGDDETDVMVTATLPRSTQNVTRTVSLSLAGSATAMVRIIRPMTLIPEPSISPPVKLQRPSR